MMIRQGHINGSGMAELIGQGSRNGRGDDVETPELWDRLL
jgi:hypothetical protein